MKRSGLFLILALAASAAAGLPQPVPTGPEVRVSGGGWPSVAASPDGRFVVAAGDAARAFAPGVEPLSEGTVPLSPVRNIPVVRSKVVSLAGGGFLAILERSSTVFFADLPGGSEAAALGGDLTLSARRLDTAGQPVGSEILLAEPAVLPAVAADPFGGFVMAWMANPAVSGAAHVVARRFDAQGSPLGPEIPVVNGWIAPKIASLPDGGFAVAWGNNSFGVGGALRVFAPDGTLRGGAELPWSGIKIGTDGAGRILVTWSQVDAATRSGVRLRGRFYASDGSPLGAEIPLHEGPPGERITFEAMALRTDGSFLITWQTDKNQEFDILARAFAADGTPAGAPFPVHARPGYQHESVLAPAVDGWIVVWSELWTQAPGLYVRHFTTGCTGLCLNNGRFQVEVTWRVPATGAEGTGTAIPLTGDTGAFWFFAPANYELVVKVLDGRGINGHFWVFYGSLTDVEFDLTVTDTATGERRTYHNPAGTMASQADTTAF